MPQLINILHNQNLLDIAIQEAGTIEAAYAIAMDNDMAVSETLTPGAQLIIADTFDDVNVQVYNYYQKHKLTTNTGIYVNPLPVETCDDELFIYADYEAGDTGRAYEVHASMAGTITSITSSLTITSIKLDDVEQTLPFTQVAGQELKFEFDTALADGEILMGGIHG